MKSELRTPEEIERRSAIFDALPNDVTELEKKLSHPGYEIRALAVDKLRQINEPGAVQPILRALKDEHPEVRRSAALGLGHYKPKESVIELVRHLREDPSAHVRALCTFSLNCIGGDEAMDGLKSALKDPDEHVRIGACWPFAHHNDLRAVDDIFKLLSDSAWSVQRAACEVLTRLGIGDKRIVGTITSLRQSPEGEEYERHIAEMRETMMSMPEEYKPSEEDMEEMLESSLNDLESQAKKLLAK